MSESLTALYKGIMNEKFGEAHRRDITGSTIATVSKAHPKAPINLDYYAELFGLPPEDVKRLPLNAVEMLHQALSHLIGETKEDPRLRQALRNMIDHTFISQEDEEEGGELEPEFARESLTTDQILEGYQAFLATLSEGTSKATKFNYKALLDLDPTKLMNPFFQQLVTTFQMEALTRMQKQGMLMFLKKLAELADSNTQIAQALTKIVRVENIATAEKTPVAEGEEKKK